MDGKKCGSAVLTALQIGQINIDKIGDVIRGRRLHAFLDGADLAEWIDVFWSNVGIIVAAETAMNIKRRACVYE